MYISLSVCRSEDNLWELFLSLPTIWAPGVGLRSLGLALSAFTHWPLLQRSNVRNKCNSRQRWCLLHLPLATQMETICSGCHEGRPQNGENSTCTWRCCCSPLISSGFCDSVLWGAPRLKKQGSS